MDELSRMLLHGTAGLQSAEDAASGNLGAALREQALSEWAAESQPARPVRPYRPYRGRGSFFRFRVGLGVVCAVILLAMILIH
jgi:hypothetical protein